MNQRMTITSAATIETISAFNALPLQLPARCIWLTGLSGAGKTTIAVALASQLRALSHAALVIDGDDVRRGVSRDLGFSAADRTENIRRVSEIARLTVEGGITAIVACIAPFETQRRDARNRFGGDQFVEVFVETPLSVCEARDCKGLYGRARSGDLVEFTGISSPYERPASPDLRLDSSGAVKPDVLASVIMQKVLGSL